MKPRVVIGSSYGNDSIALLQWFREEGMTTGAVALFNNTGWAKDGWMQRVTDMEAWARSIGISTSRTKSVGMVPLVKARKGWPRQGIQFCTDELKIKPTQGWLDLHDPDKEAICANGKRQAESAERADTPEWTPDSPLHGGRMCWSPLYGFSHDERDALIRRAGFEVLPHRSMECFPCINSKRSDIRSLAEDRGRVDLIAGVEAEMHAASPGKIKTMFRPYRHMGATGIHEIVRWGMSEHGKFNLDDGTGPSEGCTGGFCETSNA